MLDLSLLRFLASLSGAQGWTWSSPCLLFFPKSLTLFFASFNNPSLILRGFWRDPTISLCRVGLNPASDRTGRRFKWPASVGLMKKAFQRCVSSADTAYSRALFRIAVLLRVALVKSQPDWKSCHHHCSKPALVTAPLDTLGVAERPIKA